MIASPVAMLAQNAADLPSRRADIVPLVAAHQHLMSPAGVALTPPDPPLATISLPPDLDRLLRRREKVSGAPPTGDLFTEDAIIQELQTGRWQRGREKIDLFLGFMDRNLRYVPSDFAVDGNAAWIAGTIRQGTSTDETLNFVLGLKKKGDAWQIANEIFTVIPAPPYGKPVLADQLVEELDDAGIQRAVVLSTAYWNGDPRHGFTAAEAEARTRADNDWTVAQVSKYPERHDGYSGAPVTWRRMLPPLVGAKLRLDAKRARWFVHGRRLDGEAHRLATISGAADGSELRETEVPMDTLRGQVLFSYDDGSALVLGATPRLATSFTRRSILATYFATLRGNAIAWTLWRFDRDGSRVLRTVNGYPSCAASADDGAAICVEQGVRSTHLWRVERNAVVDLGNHARRYDRATASDGGSVVASSYRGHAIGVVDAMRKRGVRTALPTSDYSYVREIRASDSTVVALLSSEKGMRLVVYRLQ